MGKGGDFIKDIKNSAGKKVCRIKESEALVEIRFKGIITRIQFLKEGKAKITDVVAN